MTSLLGYDLHGPADAPVLVLGSSLGTDRRMWDPQLRYLAERFRVIRYDHLGHAASAVPPEPYAIPQLADALIELIDGLGVQRFSLGGLSLGGMVAMQVAATLPERMHRLALFCTSAHLPPAAGWLDRAAAVRSGGTAAVADAVVARWFTAAFATAHPATVAAQRDQLISISAQGYAGCCEAIAAMDVRPLLTRICAPTLVVAGADDLATPPPHAETIATWIRAGGTAARVELVPGAHLATVESAARCTDLLLAHLSG